MKALVLAGGLGSRLRPLTQTGAKQLLPVGNKPIIHYVLENIQSLGVKEVGIIVGAETSVGIQKELGDGSRWGFDIRYIHQEAPLGLAHCVIAGEDFLQNDKFLMYLGDNMLKEGIQSFASEFVASGSTAQVHLVKSPNPREFGVAEFYEDGRLKRLVEKPVEPPSNWALTGIYFFDSTIIEAAHSIKPSWRNELEITDAIQWLLDKGFSVGYRKLRGWWKDTGRPEDLLEANVLVLQSLTGNVDPSASVDFESLIVGEVKIGPNVEIKSSVVRGPVIVGEGSIVEDSYIGPSTSLGARCLVRNSEISCSIIMDDAKILEVSVPIDGSLIGREAVIHSSNGKPKALKLIVGDVSKVGLV